MCPPPKKNPGILYKNYMSNFLLTILYFHETKTNV